jgi:precorrin-6Y C5,15-methyltransferase (decarboxylating)
MIEVVGLGPAPGLATADSAGTVASAEVLAGGARLLARFPDHPGQRIVISHPVDEAVAAILDQHRAGRAVVVLADGDPLFYGIGSRLVRDLGPSAVSFAPGVTAMQTAAARLGLPWEGMRTVSLHGRSDYAPLFAALTWHSPVGVYTDSVNTPGRVAQALLERRVRGFTLNVCTDLGWETEQVLQLSLAEAVDLAAAGSSFLVLTRDHPPAKVLRPGIQESELVSQNSMLTKPYVRAAGLAALAPGREAVVWDVGAGCGSVSLEACTLAPRGQVAAVEADPARFSMLTDNLRDFGAWMVEPVPGRAPECLGPLPDPDRIFLGGGLSGPSGRAVLTACLTRLAPGGRIVAHCILLDSLDTAVSVLKEGGLEPHVACLQCSRSRGLAGSLRLVADNPVYIVSAVKPETP